MGFFQLLLRLNVPNLGLNCVNVRVCMSVGVEDMEILIKQVEARTSKVDGTGAQVVLLKGIS